MKKIFLMITLVILSAGVSFGYDGKDKVTECENGSAEACARLWRDGCNPGGSYAIGVKPKFNFKKQFCSSLRLQQGVNLYERGDVKGAYDVWRNLVHRENNVDAQKNLNILCRQNAWVCQRSGF